MPDGARPERRRQERGVRRMEQLLDAAAGLFAEIGYDSATTNKIAARAGVSPGTLYQFFSSKEDIAQALADRYVPELEQAHRDATAGDLDALGPQGLLLVGEPVENLVIARRGHIEQFANRLLLGARVLPPLTLEGQDLLFPLGQPVRGLTGRGQPERLLTLSHRLRGVHLAARLTIASVFQRSCGAKSHWCDFAGGH
jgi:AcrR family transcriptional regulator